MLKNILICIIFIIINTLSCLPYRQIQVKDFAVQNYAKIDTLLPSIKIHWNLDSNTYQTMIYKKQKDSAKWGNCIYNTYDKNFSSFTDTNVEFPNNYEYYIQRTIKVKTDSLKDSTYIDGYGYIYVGSGSTIPELRGKVLLLIDRTIYDTLALELNNFFLDLVSDGWNIQVEKVNRSEKFSSKEVESIKQTIRNSYNNKSDSLVAVILFGRIAVPYSGDFAIDGHEDHRGAWAADLYYGELDSVWTDTLIDNSNAADPRNHNIIGDGKFDFTYIPSTIDLQIGRIDFYNLPYFNVSEIELLRRYLNKNHAYRNKKIQVNQNAIIDDNFDMLSGYGFAANGWINFSSLFSPDSVKSGKILECKSNNIPAFTYGSGSGNYEQVAWVANSQDFAKDSVFSLFTMLFGSYLGDWDTKNNILRSAIASEPILLGSCFSSLPFWHFHHLSLGETIGYSVKLSQNNQYLYRTSCPIGHKLVHNALMGDPTLRLHIVKPVENLHANFIINEAKPILIRLEWQASLDNNIIGYNIYRSQNQYSGYKRINSEIIHDNIFLDDEYNLNDNYYMIRAIKHEQTPSGDYYNYSQGTYAYIYAATQAFSKEAEKQIICYPNPSSKLIDISFILLTDSYVDLSVYDNKGKLVITLLSKALYTGIHNYNWNLRDSMGNSISAGLYYVELKTKYRTINEKIFLEY